MPDLKTFMFLVDFGSTGRLFQSFIELLQKVIEDYVMEQRSFHCTLFYAYRCPLSVIFHIPWAFFI